jgi:hypothetical protein
MRALVHLTLLDADSGSTLTETEIASDELPPTFAEPTLLSLGGESWSVVEANPLTAAERLQSGQVQLTLRRLTPTSAADILFSLPTISDELPRCEPGTAGLTLHEDDWRQIELCAAALDEAIAACIAKIELVVSEKRHPSGTFKEIHLRRELPDPLPGVVITREALRAAFPGAVDLDGVAVNGAGRVIDGFALGLGSGLCLYGFWREGRAAVLAFHALEAGADTGHDAAAIAALMAAHELRLVSWCRRVIATEEIDLARAF